MVHGLVIFFLVISAVFAGVHWFAMAASLYWLYPWFDILMHTWGGVLIGLGVHALSTIKWLPLKPKLGILLVVLAIATGTWEVFERTAGLFDPATYVIDTIQDIICGFSGGLLAHILLRNYKI